jgi:hypothetical protein
MPVGTRSRSITGTTPDRAAEKLGDLPNLQTLIWGAAAKRIPEWARIRPKRRRFGLARVVLLTKHASFLRERRG